jgi:hypothetical protein
MCEKEKKQKKPPANGLQTNWPMEGGTFIGTNDKLQKLEVILHRILIHLHYSDL